MYVHVNRQFNHRKQILKTYTFKYTCNIILTQQTGNNKDKVVEWLTTLLIATVSSLVCQ